MVGCCVVGCGRNSSKPTVDPRYKSNEKNVTFHVFPANPQIRKKWADAVIIGGRVEEWLPGRNAKICSLHFNLEDIRFNKKGARIAKSAVPNIPLASKKKPPRKNKVKPVEDEVRAVEEALTSESAMDVEPYIVFDPDTPGTSSEHVCLPTSEQMEVEGTAQVEQQNATTNKVVKSASVHTFEDPDNNLVNEDVSLEEINEVLTSKTQQDVEIPDDVYLQDLSDILNNAANVLDLPGTSSEHTYLPTSEQTDTAQVEQQIARANKVAKSADVHTFDAPANSTENTANNDPCLFLYKELLEKLKILNNTVSIHRPDKSEEMQRMLDRFTKLFADEDNMPDQSLMHYYAQNIDSWSRGDTDPLDVLKSLAVLENSEPCTVSAQK